jgi:hypothetical protein
MKLILFKAPAVILMTLILMTFFALPAHADGVETASISATKVRTEMITRQEVVCETTNYGVKNCHTVITEIPKHIVENSGVPYLPVFSFTLMSILALGGYSLVVRQ